MFTLRFSAEMGVESNNPVNFGNRNAGLFSDILLKLRRYAAENPLSVMKNLNKIAFLIFIPGNYRIKPFVLLFVLFLCAAAFACVQFYIHRIIALSQLIVLMASNPEPVHFNYISGTLKRIYYLS
jgi:hypothetical protein